MCYHHRWYSEPATDGAAALPKTHRSLTIGTAAIIIISATRAATVRAAAVLLTVTLANVALEGRLYRTGIILGKLDDRAVTLTIILCQSTHKYSAYLHGNPRIPLLWCWWLLFQMRVPHLLYKFVGKGCAACQYSVDTDTERVLVGIAPSTALPSFGWP